MSTQNRPLIVGLVSPGLFWLATSVAQGQVSPRPTGHPSTPAPASPSTFSVLLMSNGTVVRGEITDDPAGGVYRLKTLGGKVPYPKSSVKRAGHSIEDLYRYQVAALPPGDFDERMKLVKWCLAQNLPDLAREQLTAVLEMSPNDVEATKMAANLEANAQFGKVDPALRQTSAEGPQDDAPGSLPPELVKRGRKGYGNNLPEIFDLPPALAVRRASEFVEWVQPVLQVQCASCHNEKYDGSFQLVQTRTSKDKRNPDIARANLDAALRLVNPDDLARSDLLAAGLVPHGPRKAAIFRGSNDPQYRQVSTWVRSLKNGNADAARKAAGGGEGVFPAGFAPEGPADGFASDKTKRAAGVTGSDSSTSAAIRPAGPQRVVNDVTESADFSGGKAADFPLPFAMGGEEPARSPAPVKSASGPGRTPANASKPKGARSALPRTRTPEPDAAEEGPAVAPTTAKQVSPGAVAVEMNGNPNDLPGMNQPMYPSSKPRADAGSGEDAPENAMPPLPGATPTPAPAEPKKKVKLDPALLEKMIKARVSTP